MTEDRGQRTEDRGQKTEDRVDYRIGSLVNWVICYWLLVIDDLEFTNLGLLALRPCHAVAYRYAI